MSNLNKCFLLFIILINIEIFSVIIIFNVKFVRMLVR